MYTFHALQPGHVLDRAVHGDRRTGSSTRSRRTACGSSTTGRSLAYSADTAPCDALLRLAAGADAFLCEASYLASEDNPPGLHMTGRDAGEAATKAGVGRLLLTHLVPAWGSEARRSTRPGRPSPVRSTWSGPGARYDI